MRSKRPSRALRAVELFSGAGGLAMACSMEGFDHLAVVERDRHCCNNIRRNQERGFSLLSDWPLIESDVRDVCFGQFFGADLVCGGPPCQPFSIGGKSAGPADERDMFPVSVRAISEIQPRAFLFENVRGLLRPAFANYLEYVRLHLTFPGLKRKRAETAERHFERLQRAHTSNMHESGSCPTYQVEVHLANAADYGVPQKRYRVFLVGFRSDLGISWNFPSATHSQDALVRSKLSGKYWEIAKVPKKLRRMESDSVQLSLEDDGLRPWATVRQAIHGLGRPSQPESVPNHMFQPGARRYPGHTGSILDEPAKTLKAGAHGVPGGENMVVLDDESFRYFTVRESARIQTFPDEFVFQGSWTESMRQLGNAVPCLMAQAVVRSIGSVLGEGHLKLGGSNRKP